MRPRPLDAKFIAPTDTVERGIVVVELAASGLQLQGKTNQREGLTEAKSYLLMIQ